MGKNSRKERSRRYKAKLKRDKGLGSCKNRLRVKNKKLTRMVVKRRKDEKAEEISTERTRNVTCTKATTVITRQNLQSTLPINVRKILWSTLKKSIGDDPTVLGKGVFGKCFFGFIGPLKACIKVFCPNAKYKECFFSEAWILSKLAHENLPWLFAVCHDEKNSILIMSHHAFRGKKESVTIHSALQEPCATTSPSVKCWKNILLGMTSALVYLLKSKILHNDIKADNVVIEYLPPDFNSCRSVIVDFGKACLVSCAISYELTPEQQKKYKEEHPQIAPEIRNGLAKQSYNSDVYSFGRVLKKINSFVLKIPVLFELSQQCIERTPQRRPTCEELHKFFSNLFSTRDIE